MNQGNFRQAKVSLKEMNVDATDCGGNSKIYGKYYREPNNLNLWKKNKIKQHVQDGEGTMVERGI